MRVHILTILLVAVAAHQHVSHLTDDEWMDSAEGKRILAIKRHLSRHKVEQPEEFGETADDSTNYDVSRLIDPVEPERHSKDEVVIPSDTKRIQFQKEFEKKFFEAKQKDSREWKTQSKSKDLAESVYDKIMGPTVKHVKDSYRKSKRPSKLAEEDTSKISERELAAEDSTPPRLTKPREGISTTITGYWNSRSQSWEFEMSRKQLVPLHCLEQPATLSQEEQLEKQKECVKTTGDKLRLHDLQLTEFVMKTEQTAENMEPYGNGPDSVVPLHSIRPSPYDDKADHANNL